MAIEYIHIGWCKKGNRDKVWGIIKLNGDDSQYGRCSYVTVWGRRGKALQTKIYKDEFRWTMDDMFAKKLHKSKAEECYIRVDKTKLDQVYPEFENDLKETAFWSTFKI